MTRTDNKLAVRFRVDGTEAALSCTARNLETFANFRRLAADRLGVWLRDDAERGGRRGKLEWNDAVQYAFEAGRREVRT